MRCRRYWTCAATVLTRRRRGKILWIRSSTPSLIPIGVPDVAIKESWR